MNKNSVLRISIGKTAPATGGCAWVCRGISCLPAITDPAELERVLDSPA